MTTAERALTLFRGKVSSWPGKDPRSNTGKQRLAAEIANDLGGQRSGRTYRWVFEDGSQVDATPNGVEVI